MLLAVYCCDFIPEGWRFTVSEGCSGECSHDLHREYQWFQMCPEPHVISVLKDEPISQWRQHFGDRIFMGTLGFPLLRLPVPSQQVMANFNNLLWIWVCDTSKGQPFSMEPLFKGHLDGLYYFISWALHWALSSFKMFRAWACEMAQPVKMLTTNSDEFHPWSHMVPGKG